MVSIVCSSTLARRGLRLAMAAALFGAAMAPATTRAQSLFGAAEVDPSRFVVVAAPIGSGERSQLNIYEQTGSRRACFAVGSGKPAAVDPLLASFDFTGTCSRYIDGNGFSVRVGGSDLGTVYRLMVTRSADDVLLLAVPTRAGAGPEMVVARAGGRAGGFLKLDFDPGWRLMRRSFRGRALGHVYVYRETFPDATAAAATVSPPGTAPGGVAASSAPDAGAPAVSSPPAAGAPATLPPAPPAP